ncbi:bifunctional 2-polyprenyl-6-hydroxyphenol methylase/3-demethylubiquinol 3-O-methyltransferase UbiG [Tengunoibacter tsumagoiensis]|uniref:Ubiquinone biosynthesis O-methyltransferase n=1 Tax=Tengunoibacter tsumagoiensis TaxID=2014871 RepID=A0A401ZVQ1_9CHLR|nr:bifunctional 2-polyprenyl-6-hydroxyphenol methylase/3-demethylubiquinol 3-O-methyltransferase UbiG [Tengunoibacter tsumagoiensis]GCE10814.1 ubiquinone biosynthesis O-methyltransferase [Tengunoibacter tsumagoiensis]
MTTESWFSRQEAIFADYGWWDRHNLLYLITEQRCNYIVSRIERIFGEGALSQQEILEVGCGGGLLSEGLARRGACMWGLDPNERALEQGRHHAQTQGLGGNIFFQAGSAEALPYAAGSFSVIICLDVLEHVRDLNQTIREIARVLAPGGLFIFDTINRTWLAQIALIWIGERFFQKSGLVPGLHHYRSFIRPVELQTVLRQNELVSGEMLGFMPRRDQGRWTLGTGWFKGVSYVGYATRACD